MGFKVYKDGQNYNLWRYNIYINSMSEREIIGYVKKAEAIPPTKPRLACKTPRPGCPCCDYPKNFVKKLDRKARRRQNKRVEQNEDKNE